jgi:hypothetical protein
MVFVVGMAIGYVVKHLGDAALEIWKCPFTLAMWVAWDWK